MLYSISFKNVQIKSKLRSWGYRILAMCQMRKSEEPLVVYRSLTWWLIDVCGSSAILLAVHLARTTIEPLQRVSDKYRPTGSDQQEDLAPLGSVQLRQTWPSELWPRDCLEKGHFSRRMATYCGHSNAPAEYAVKKKIGQKSSPDYGEEDHPVMPVREEVIVTWKQFNISVDIQQV